MVLEATVIILDNSEWMRNGDYMPSRIEAQQDAVNLICAAKTQSNPESMVSIMSMAKSKNGAKAEVLVTLTQDLGKILSSLHALAISGETDFSAALQVAQLVLKHRQNKHQHQRIVAFVGSPIKESSDDLVKLGKRLKKNNIAVDLVNFGEEAENAEKLENFIKSVNTADESHLITIPAGPHILSDMLLSSPIIAGEGGSSGFGAAAAASAAAAAASGAIGGEFDFDPSMDPELAMVLRISMEEERARQEAQQKKAEDGQQGGDKENKPADQSSTSAQDVDMSSDYDDELQQALAMSMAADSSNAGEASSPSSDSSAMDLSEEDQIAHALALSHGTPASTSSSATTSNAPAATPAAPPASDQDLNSVLQSLPGVDMNDERIRSVLNSLQPEKKDKDENEKK